MPSILDDRRLGGNVHLNGQTYGDATNSLINTATNINNNDILPAVGMYKKLIIKKGENYYFNHR